MGHLEMSGDPSPAPQLLAQLKQELMDKRLDDDGRTKLLEQLKIIGRNPATASPIFRANSIRTLLEYGFDHGINAASREAMRCLANAMLLSEGCRQTVIDLGYSGRIAERMKNNNRDDEFLTARILFFATYSGKLDVRELIDKHSLTTSLHQILDRAILRLKSSAQDSNPITTLAHQETLKLLPNLVYYSPDTAFDLAPLLAPLATLLLKVPLPSPALQPPITHLINAILNLNPPPSRIEDPSIREPLYPPSAPSSLATHLIAILSSSLPSSGVSTKESHILLSPLLSLIRALHASAPSPDVITTIRAALLPSDKARAQPLGQGADLPARILRAAVAPPGAIASSGGTARDVLAALLYELSDEDAGTLTRNIGYGHAVGILQRLGKDIAPPQDTGADGSSGSSSSKGIGKEFINPVTGQRIDAEPRAELPEMTDEEKEREAERLFVLFERLRATGVVDIMNPVGQAAREGRLG